MVVLLREYIKPALILIMVLQLMAGCASVPGPEVKTEQEAKAGQQPADTTAKGGLPVRKVTPEVQQLFDQAVLTLRNGQYKQAIKQFKSVSRKAPRLAAPHINQAIAYRQLGDLLMAEKATQEALKNDSKSPEALNMLGLIKRSNGDFKAAKKNYEKAISIYPDYAEAHLNLAMLCDIYLVDWPCAKTHYDRFLAISGKQDKQVKGWVADLDRRMKKVKK